jgi:transposase
VFRDGGAWLSGRLSCDQAELRREDRRLRENVELLKRATAFFAKETR